ncbi:hypothetical protein L7F22_005189 [Adiantum nelumboides]|nr:hypothetical protein [Adiantum nelumboides]
MEQTTHLKQTVVKLDHALERLQEIQSALKGRSPLPLTTEDPNPEELPQLGILYGLGGNHLARSGSARRWSMPAPLTHDHALSNAIAVSKFAKKTVDMVKVQKKKQAAKSTNSSSYCPLQADQASALQPSNRINLPQQVDMSSPRDASRKARGSSKENNRTPHRSKLELKDDIEIHNAGVVRLDTSMEKPKRGKNRDEPSSLVNVNKHARPTRTGSEEADLQPNIFKLRALKHVEEATTDPFAGHGNDMDPNVAIKKSSLSTRTSMRMEDEEEKHGTPGPSKQDTCIDSFSSAVASKSFSVQLEEIKSSRKKSWSFTHQGRTSDNLVVMFPNPTFDETTPPMTTPPEYHQKAIHANSSKQSSLQEKAATLPSTTVKIEAVSSDRKGTFPRKEKIVRLSPCVTKTSIAQKPQPQPTSIIACASTSKRTSSTKKQKWLCTSKHPPCPTLIRRLPESHEMMEIKQTSQNYVDEEERNNNLNDYTDNAPDPLRRSWSFSKPSAQGSSHTSLDARRFSQNPRAGGQAFSFLSRHFHAWKLASKQDK